MYMIAEHAAMTFNIRIDFLATLLLVSRVIPDAKATVVTCDGMVFNNTYYEKEELIKDIEKPYNLVMDIASNQLFFSHTIWDRADVDFAIMTYEFNKKFKRDLKGIPGGYAIAYDKDNERVYLGGHDGIYKYDPVKNTITFFAQKDKSIWSLFIRNNIYYIEYPTQILYVYKKGEFVREKAINMEINTFFITNKSEYYFSNDTALFKKENLNAAPVIIDTNTTIKQIAEDKYGNIYFCAIDGIYAEDKPHNKLKNLAKIDNAFGMTFDGNGQLIFSNLHGIYRLLPSKYDKICMKVLADAEKEELKKRRSLNIMSLVRK